MIEAKSEQKSHSESCELDDKNVNNNVSLGHSRNIHAELYESATTQIGKYMLKADKEDIGKFVFPNFYYYFRTLFTILRRYSHGDHSIRC
jgi:hypothetical protein